MSAGFATTRFESPDVTRASPPIGSIAVARISFRPLPVRSGLRTSQARRCITSPSAMPPTVVLMKSFSDARLFSKKNSHVALPNAATAVDS